MLPAFVLTATGVSVGVAVGMTIGKDEFAVGTYCVMFEIIGMGFVVGMKIFVEVGVHSLTVTVDQTVTTSGSELD